MSRDLALIALPLKLRFPPMILPSDGTADATDTRHQPLDSTVHQLLLKTLIERGRAATTVELCGRLGASAEVVRSSLLRLEANHGVVMHPGTLDPWLVHPFSTTPTLFHVRNATRGWWAPCVWCALGVAVLVPGPVRIATRLGGETEACEITYNQGRVAPGGLVAHFPIPIARAWDNVHRHCACTLVFSGRDSVETWCASHGIARGEVVPLAQVSELARVWYGDHLAPDWRKPTAIEAQATFASVGLTSEHWRVGGGDQRF